MPGTSPLLKPAPAEHPLESDLAAIQKALRACMQCGTCTGSCASAEAMDYVPRQLWRWVQVGDMEAVFHSRTFYLCSACYYCTLRCPRGLPLTEAMTALKRLAGRMGLNEHRESAAFYQAFMQDVRRNGRVNEVTFMNRYFLAARNPCLPLRFASVGVKLLRRGKLRPDLTTFWGRARFDRLFEKVRELEEA